MFYIEYLRLFELALRLACDERYIIPMELLAHFEHHQFFLTSVHVLLRTKSLVQVICIDNVSTILYIIILIPSYIFFFNYL